MEILGIVIAKSYHSDGTASLTLSDRSEIPISSADFFHYPIGSHYYREDSYKRPTWDEYFLNIAQVVSSRADCSRLKVGAVIVRDNRIVSCGYNGAPAGVPGCLAGNCPRANSSVPPGSSYDTGPGTCIAIHAEANAIIYAGQNNCLGSTLYCTQTPCEGCHRLIKAAGIRKVVTLGEQSLSPKEDTCE